MSALSERVIARLRKHGVTADVIPDGSTIRRTHAGWAMRANGAWSWYFVSPEGRPLTYGSQWAASDLVKCRGEWQVEHENRTTPDLSIDPCGKCAACAAAT